GEAAAQKVWDEHFVMVQHFAQSGAGVPGEYVDSTSHQNNGQGGSGLGYTTPTAVLENTVIGYAQYFNGRSDYINFPDSDDFSISTTGHLTISLWISPAVLKFTNSKQYIRWMGKGAPGQAEWQFIMYNYGGKGDDGKDRSQWISFYVCSPSGGAGAGGGGSAGYINPDSWLFVTATTDMKKSYGFFNGIRSPLSDEWAQYNIQYQNGDDPLRIGTDYMSDDDWWKGRIDEVRFSNITRSDAWIKADYYSQKDGLLKCVSFQNHAPVFNRLENMHVREGEFILFNISATDPAENNLIFSATNIPPGAVFDPVDKVFFWKPEIGQSGEYEINFQVSDGIYITQAKVNISVDKAKGFIINNNSSQDKTDLLILLIVSIVVFRIVSALLILVLHNFRKL
ncbi:TPA: hypothetical protein ENX78_17265, partial [Candidatus Poribacteria bacterium]|nr:hypothetical protein [Candidatus Poribacteria bacterium]